MMGLWTRSVAPTPSGFLLVSFLLPPASGVAAWPGLLAAGRKGLFPKLRRWSGGLCPLLALSEGHLLALA